MTRRLIGRYHELQVYEAAFDTAMQVLEVSRGLPEEEQKLRSQMVRSSRLVCANIAEAWQRRRYENAFVGSLNAAEVGVAETQTWVEFAVSCGYVDAEVGQEMMFRYTEILAVLGRMIEQADSWTF